LGLPIIDTSLAIVRRGLKGLPIFRPDRKHIHHHLVRSGLSRRRAVLILYALSLVFLLMALGACWSQGRLVPILVGVMFLGFIVAARSCGFIPDWLAVGKAVGNSLEIRKETRYVIALTGWFELEAERCRSVKELWENFQFVALKLVFSHVKLQLEDGERLWQWDGISFDAPGLQQHRFELKGRDSMTLQVVAETEVLPPQLFEHLAELAAESWQKAAQCWQRAAQLPVRFDSARFSPNGRVRPSRTSVPAVKGIAHLSAKAASSANPSVSAAVGQA
jgi:UDP-GlcNAc:undecaprenyl-phosphate GlcNAc-1-phosphate transferase